MFVLAVVLPALFFVLFEAGLRLAGYGYPSGFFVRSRVEGRSVFSDNPRFSLRFFPPELARPSCHLAVPAEKPPGTFRIVVLGGSAAMGDPDFSFGLSRMLETMLRIRHPGARFEVINAAVTAINSNVVLPIAKDCARLKPDLFVVYMGNNEVIGSYGPGTVFAPFMSSLGFIRANVFVRSTRTGQLLQNLSRRMKTPSGGAQAWGGVDMFTRNRLRLDDKRMEAVYGHFRENLGDICGAGRRSGAKVIVSTVAVNLKDCAPFGSLHRSDLNEASVQAWDDYYRAGVESESSGRFEEAVDNYLKASVLDDTYADLQFRMARCSLAMGRHRQAAGYYARARELDALRFRADARINEIIAGMKGREGVVLADAEKAFESESPCGIPGGGLFYDHVHPNFRGTAILAKALMEQAEKVLGLESRGDIPTEKECSERLAFTTWDRYRIEKEILERMKSPAFAGRLDNAESVRRATEKSDSLKGTLGHGALAEAVESYRCAIAGRADDWVLRNNLGMLLLDAGGDPAGAVDMFRSVLKLFPFDYLSHHNLGLALARQGKLGEAAVCYEEALRIKPDFSKARFNLAEALERRGRFVEAMAHYMKLQLAPQAMAEVHNRYGERLAGEGKTGEAISQFGEALKLCPDSYDAHSRLGRLYSQTGQNDLAAGHWSEAVRIRPENAGGHVDLASLFFVRGDYGNAVLHYEKALKIRPGLPEVQNNLGLALCKQNEFEKGISHFRKALAARPDYTDARNNMAGALAQLGRHEEAILELRKSLRADPDNPDLLNNLGAELLKAGRTGEAVPQFEKALQLNPGLYSARNNLGVALSRLREGRESEGSR